MEDFRKKTSTPESSSESSYPASIEEMSEKWREIQQQEQTDEKHGFVERNYLVLGIGIGLLIIAFLVVVGGFAFLVWNAR
jgi:hypothetical protein